ncbi:hypothetical protein KPL71_023376 [Citrus sinensis]|uniref:Uncharacterized protein n=1 Tax=Citrus sinensis TaxID=2711 RepID=A0ACB8IJ00_CITSI|nr:hypothetical protein KPL71_023376 [Citrus sinensis]
MRKYKSVEFQFDQEIEKPARRLRKEHRELQAAIAMDDLQDLRNLNCREEIQPVNVHAVLTPQTIHLGIVRPDAKADNFELKPVMFQMLQTVGQFNGLPSEDPHLHLKLFLELETFYNDLNPSTRLMVDASTNGALLFKFYNEAYEILDRIANNNYQWPSPIQAAARGTTGVHNNQTAAAPSGFYQQNQEQRSINNDQLSSLEGLITDYIVKNEAVIQSHNVSLRNLENQIGQLTTALSNRPQGSLPSNLNDPRREGKEHCKPTGESSQAATFAENDDPTPVDNEGLVPTHNMAKEKQSTQPAVAQQFRHPPPFPQRFQKQQQDKQFSKILGVLTQLHNNISFVEALEQIPNYAKFFKDILTKKIKLGEFEIVVLTQECSRMLQSKIPQKIKDPGSFTIPYFIGTKYSGKAFCNLGASINLMPLSVFKQLGVGECRPTTVTLQLADISHAYPEGKIEDVLVKVDKFIF